MTIGDKELAEIINLELEFAAAVGVANEHTMELEVLELDAAVDVAPLFDGLLLTFECLMLNELEAMTIIDESVASDACSLVIGLGETAIDDEPLAACTEWALALSGPDRDVPIDDTPLVGVEPELTQDEVAGVGVIGELIVGALMLLGEVGVVDEIAFESGHAILVEERGVWTAPEIPHIVESLILLGGARDAEIGDTNHLVDTFHEGLALERLAADGDLLERAVGIERDGGMIEETVVADEEQPAMLIEATEMLLELLAGCERVVELRHKLLLLGAETIGVGRVDGREERVAERVVAPIDGDDATGEVDEM